MFIASTIQWRLSLGILGSGEFLNGKVYYVSIHKQVHTDNEVADTWHALRRRFGYSGIGTNPIGGPIISDLVGGPE